MTALLATIVAAVAVAPAGGNMDQSDIPAWPGGGLVGKPVDMAPWAFAYRGDVAVQKPPEGAFIPRRLARIDKVYRTASSALSPEDLKSIYYDMPDLLKPLPPQPKGRLVAGLLWTGRLCDFRVELEWPKGAPIPDRDRVEVRTYPTSFGWFGWTVDKIMGSPDVSDDGRTWTYKSDPAEKMDSSYSVHVPAATEMIAVFVDGQKTVVPTLRITGPDLGVWRAMRVEIEWGFDGKVEAGPSSYEAYMAHVGPTTELLGEGRHGVEFPVVYAPGAVAGLDSRVTVHGGGGTFTFRISDLDKGPIYVPSKGVVVSKAGTIVGAREFVKGLSKKRLESVVQMTRSHPEAASFEELMRNVRLWTCPPGTELRPFAEVPEAAVQVELPDPMWTAAWRAATQQLRGQNMWGGLAFEVGRVAHEMDMIGLHGEADRVYEHFLKSPGVKSDGDYSDGLGSLEWAASLRHDMGYSHDGTHASTGRLLFAMCERYFLTGNREWFERNRARLQAAADWIIRQRNAYMRDLPNRKDLVVAGLMPPEMLGDYAIPSCDWHWYYVDDALSLQAIQRFGDALAEIDPKASKPYLAEAEAFRKDLRRVVHREVELAPVRLGRDGAYHSYIPRMAYARGLTGPELGAPQFPDCDMFMGGLPLAEPHAALDAGDPAMVDTLMLMEEMGTSPERVTKAAKDRKDKGVSTDDAWFWNCFVILPKASHNGNVFLYQDDIPNFLRFWMNAYASVVGADGKLWEHWHLGNFDACGAPDNGTAGWFMECFRDMLAMEVGHDLWIARGTPRAWLEQGKRISVRGAPTCFGDLAYEITSDVDHGRVSARIEVPARRPIGAIVLRLRHPKSLKMRGVTVNGKAWSRFDAAKETVTLVGLAGSVEVVARY